MNIPENDIIAENEDAADDQRSQQDVQSDGIDAVPPSEEDETATEIDHLEQADRSSEAAFTLDPDKGIASGQPDRK